MFTILFLATYQKNHIIGGDNLYAATYEEQNIYEVKIENNMSKVITTMTVMAMTEQEAYDDVALNGWTVIGVKLIKERVKDEYTLSTDYIKTEIPNKIELEDAIEIPPAAKEPVKDNKMVVSKESGNKNVADNLNLVPTSKDLELILTIHFQLGDVAPIFDDEISKLFDSLPKDRDYVLFGNADDVAVGKNATYSNNYELSYLRADHIKKLLIEKGYNADKIKTIGLGTGYPLEKSGKKGSLKNRRVEIYGFRTQG